MLLTVLIITMVIFICWLLTVLGKDIFRILWLILPIAGSGLTLLMASAYLLNGHALIGLLGFGILSISGVLTIILLVFCTYHQLKYKFSALEGRV